MKPWIDLSDNYLYDVSGCSSTTAARALRNAAQDFCARTKAWRVYLAPITTVANQDAYVVPLAAGQELVKVLSAKLDGRDIDTLLDAHIGSSASGVIMTSAHEVLVQPPPAAGQQLVLRVALQPSNEATGLEDVLYAKYASTIAHGAKAALYGASQKPYSDRESAGREKIEFDDGIRKVIFDVAKAHGSAPLRTKPNFM